MKKTLFILLVISLLAFACACQAGNVAPSPSPMLTKAPATTGGLLPSLMPETSPNASPATTGAGSISEGIKDFEEGTVVNIEDLPEVKDAVEKEYPDATIKTVTHALYKDAQVYKVVLELKDKTTKEVFVSPEGLITPSEENGGAAASPNASPQTSPKS